jgi:hypothetical protein
MGWTLVAHWFVVAESVVAVLVVLGNSLVLLTLAHYRQLRTITNIFIASLAAADLCVGLVMVPVAVLSEDAVPHDFYSCLVLVLSVMTFTQVSILCLLGVALERFLAIIAPFRYYHIMNKHNAIVLNVVLWVIGIAISMIPLIFPKAHRPDGVRCDFVNVIERRYAVLLFYYFYIPILLFNIAVYSYIYYVVRSHRLRIYASTCPSRHTLSKLDRKLLKKERSDTQGAKWLFIVVLLFALCWLPLRIHDCIRYFFYFNLSTFIAHSPRVSSKRFTITLTLLAMLLG